MTRATLIAPDTEKGGTHMAIKITSSVYAGKSVNVPHTEHFAAGEKSQVRFDADGNYILPVRTVQEVKDGKVVSTKQVKVPASETLGQALLEFYPREIQVSGLSDN